MSLRGIRVRKGNRKFKPQDDTTTETKSNETPKAKREAKQTDFDTAFKKVMDTLVMVASVPIRVLTYLLNPPGNAVLFALAALYFLAVNIEGYYQALPGNDVAFLPKPFIEDEASLSNVFSVILDPSLWMMSVVSLVVQAIQTWSLRENTIEEQRRAYTAVSHYRIPKKEENQISLAEVRRQQFKNAGMKTENKMGGIVLLAYFIDGIIAFANYPLFGTGSTGLFLTNFCWIVLSMFGAELFLTCFIMALRDLLPIDQRTDPRTRMN